MFKITRFLSSLFGFEGRESLGVNLEFVRSDNKSSRSLG